MQHTNHQQDNITKTDPKKPFDENKKEARSFKNAIVMVSVSGNAAMKVMEAAAQIPDDQLGVDGREDDPHVTIKFGVKDDPELLATTLKGVTPFSVRLGKLKVFIPSESSGRQAPVVAEAIAPQLSDLHAKVDAAMSARPDDFPFSPHVTLAYLKPEIAKQYEGSNMVEGLTFFVDHVVLSRADRSKVEISLEQAKAVSAADHKFVKERQNQDEVLVAVDPQKFDTEWIRDKGYYVGPGGTENAIRGRYERFQRWLQDNPGTPIGAPIVSWNDVTNSPSFTNGRHRFAVLRDMGAKKVYISVPKEQVSIFKKFAKGETLTESGPGIFYHGTTKAIAAKILKEGLSPNVEDRAQLSAKGYVYLSVWAHSASLWAKAQARKRGGEPALIRIELPANLSKKVQEDAWEIGVDTKTDRRFKGTIPAAYCSLWPMQGELNGMSWNYAAARKEPPFQGFGATYDIQKALAILKSKPRPAVPAERHFMVDVDSKHVPTTDYSKPGILATTDSGFQFLIDGNHRATKAKAEGKEFLAYPLTVEETKAIKKLGSHKTPPLSDTQYQNMNDTSGEGTNAYADIRERVKDTREETPLEVLNPTLFKDASDPDVFHYQLKKALGQLTPEDEEKAASIESRNATPALLADVQTQTEPYKYPGYAGEHRLWEGSVMFALTRTIHGAYLTDLKALHPKQGDGHRFMEWLKSLADKHGVEIHGYADPVGSEGLDTDQLLDWYKRHGFVFMDGRRMVRSPKSGSWTNATTEYRRWIDFGGGDVQIGGPNELHWEMMERLGQPSHGGAYDRLVRGAGELNKADKTVTIRGYQGQYPSNSVIEAFRSKFPKYKLKEALALAMNASEKEAAPKDWILPTALALGLGAPPAATPSTTPMRAPAPTHHEQTVDPKAQNMEKLMVAIGRAEGARPERHNPGNLADINGNIRTFKTDAEGKAALKHQLEEISAGTHPHIKPTHTLEKAGLIYSDGDPNWAHNVSLIMRVPKTIHMKDLIDGNYTPRPPKPKAGAAAAPMTLFQALESLRPQFVAVAQRVYDENIAANVEDPDGEHGICDEIAQEIQGVIASHTDAEITEGGQDGDDHAWVIAYRGKEVYGIDIAPSVYESGGGYSWKLHEGVKIEPRDVEIFRIDIDPEQLKLSSKVAAAPAPEGFRWDVRKDTNREGWTIRLFPKDSSDWIGNIEIVQPEGDITPAKTKEKVFVFDSQVRPRYRGRGLGKLIYEKAIEVAREQGFKWFLAGTYTSPDARNVWNSLKKRYHVEDDKEFATGFTPATHALKLATREPIPPITPQYLEQLGEQARDANGMHDRDAESGDCEPVSDWIYGKLVGVGAHVVNGNYRGDHYLPHAWVVVGGYYVDASHDQFNSWYENDAYVPVRVGKVTDADYKADYRTGMKDPRYAAAPAPAKQEVKIHPEQGGWSFSATVGKDLAGFLTMARRGDDVFVFDMTVEPEYRRMGIATAMYTRAMEEFKKKGFIKFYQGETQSDDAIGLWSGLEHHFKVEHDREGKYIRLNHYKVSAVPRVKTALQIEVPKSTRSHFWEEPPVGNLEFWAYRHPVNILPGEKIVFTFDGSPIARAVCHHTEAPGQSKCENTGKFEKHHKVYWDPRTFVRLDGK